MSKPVQFHITFKVTPDGLTAFESMLVSLKTDLLKVEGCTALAIFRHDEAKENTFTLLETWDVKELHQAHVSRLQNSGEWSKIEALLATPPEGFYLTAM